MEAMKTLWKKYQIKKDFKNKEKRIKEKNHSQSNRLKQKHQEFKKKNKWNMKNLNQSQKIMNRLKLSKNKEK